MRYQEMLRSLYKCEMEKHISQGDREGKKYNIIIQRNEVKVTEEHSVHHQWRSCLLVLSDVDL